MRRYGHRGNDIDSPPGTSRTNKLIVIELPFRGRRSRSLDRRAYVGFTQLNGYNNINK